MSNGRGNLDAGAGVGGKGGAGEGDGARVGGRDDIGEEGNNRCSGEDVNPAFVSRKCASNANNGSVGDSS